MNENEALKKKFLFLSERADSCCYSTFTEFLSLYEISLLKAQNYPLPPTLFAGYENGERCVAGFGCDDVTQFPIVCIKIEPANRKFADALNHRDILGAIMNLGINRNTTGDIMLSDNTAYLFCLESISGYIIDNLSKVRHTTVKCTLTQNLPDFIGAKPESSEIVVSSLRADTVIAGIYKLSRKEVSALFAQEKVFINQKAVTKESVTPKDGDLVSVRGFGRFIFNEALRKTKKDRIVISVSIYR